MAIQKPEWFKVDPAKFLSDAQVDVMSTLELGACLRLLCRQWLDGYIPDDLRLLARLCRLDATAMDEAWVTLEPFFPAIEPGKRANRYMWIEHVRRESFGMKRKDSMPHPLPHPMGYPCQTQCKSRPDQSRPEQKNPLCPNKAVRT